MAAWLRDHRNREVQIGETRGALTSFIVEPFVAHAAEDEYYVAIQVCSPGMRGGAIMSTSRGE